MMNMRLRVSEDTYWKLQEQAVAHRMSVPQYITSLVGGEQIPASYNVDEDSGETIPDYDAIFAQEAAERVAEEAAKKTQPKRKRK